MSVADDVLHERLIAEVSQDRPVPLTTNEALDLGFRARAAIMELLGWTEKVRDGVSGPSAVGSEIALEIERILARVLARKVNGEQLFCPRCGGEVWQPVSVTHGFDRWDCRTVGCLYRHDDMNPEAAP